jgi:hypothetical protein
MEATISNPPYLIELSMFDDGSIVQTWPAETESDARAILNREYLSLTKWAKGNLEPDANGDAYLPTIAQILIRPEADEDGDYPQTYLWEKL